MLFIKSPFSDPYHNLSMEEYFFRKNPLENYCILWQNDNTIVIGKYQNPYQEINLDYAREKGVMVARRMTGGGAVYHDRGNLNYTFIATLDDAQCCSYQAFCIPIIKALKKINVDANFSGRNDLIINGKKFSGCAEYSRGNRTLHHGCIMIDTDISMISKILRINPAKMLSHGVKSVSSRVTTVNQCIPLAITVEKFTKILTQQIYQLDNVKEYHITDEDFKAIQKLSVEKYSQWDWIYGNTPKFQVHLMKKFPEACLEIDLTAHNMIIEEIRFSGDFFTKKSLEELENFLCGKKLDDNLVHILEDAGGDDYIKGISTKDIVEVLHEMKVTPIH